MTRAQEREERVQVSDELLYRSPHTLIPPDITHWWSRRVLLPPQA